jgi:hypothetical protein
VLEEFPEGVGELAFEAAEGFFAGLAFGELALVVGAGWGVDADLDDRDAVQDGLSWRFPPGSKRWGVLVPELALMGAVPVILAKRCSPM